MSLFIDPDDSGALNARLKALQRTAFWDIDGVTQVARQFEPHLFAPMTRHRFNASHPALSCADWTEGLSAATRRGAIEQVQAAVDLDPAAAMSATCWGAFRVFGYHWRTLGYASVYALVEACDTLEGHCDLFGRLMQAQPVLTQALAAGDWINVAQFYAGPIDRLAELLAARAAYFEANEEADPALAPTHAWFEVLA